MNARMFRILEESPDEARQLARYRWRRCLDRASAAMARVRSHTGGTSNAERWVDAWTEAAELNAWALPRELRS